MKSEGLTWGIGSYAKTGKEPDSRPGYAGKIEIVYYYKRMKDLAARGDSRETCWMEIEEPLDTD